MDKGVLENHERYSERKNLYKSFGYDIDKERDFIIEKAQPLYGDILEAGTGKGHFSLALAKAGYHFTSFDISETEQAIAKLNLKYFGLDNHVDFCIEDGEHLSFKVASFDIIFCINMLHHLINPYQVINEFFRVLSLGGKIIISDFTEEGFKIMDKIHILEGRTHDVSKATMTDIESYLIDKGLRTQKYRSKFQEVLIAYRQII